MADGQSQITSQIDEDEGLINDLHQVAFLVDHQPIRASCFSPTNPQFFVLGTNSKSLKFCRLHSSFVQGLTDVESTQTEGIQIVHEETEHHNGSIYCVDWSQMSRLVATGSNDKLIKILQVPDFEHASIEDQEQIWKDVKELELVGHKAIVRTVCFKPFDPTTLLSGGYLEKDVKVWNT